MEVDELNKFLANIYVSVRKTDGSYYKKTSLLSIRAALDRHLKAPPNNKKFSICDNNMFSHAGSICHKINFRGIFMVKANHLPRCVKENLRNTKNIVGNFVPLHRRSLWEVCF